MGGRWSGIGSWAARKFYRIIPPVSLPALFLLAFPLSMRCGLPPLSAPLKKNKKSLIPYLQYQRE